MKIEINPENSKSVQPNTAVDAVPANTEVTKKTAEDFIPGGLTKDLWDKRNLMNSVSAVWDNEDTASVSDEAKRGVGIVGDPRIVGQEDAE